MSDEEPLAALSEQSSQYRQLFGIAYRILGSTHDAQDAVQDALERWLKLDAAQRSEIRDPQGWLVRVIGRLCLDVVRSARRRHESYPGIWLPEPIVGPDRLGDPAADAARDPELAAELGESVSIAMLTAMERLSPIERVCFVLHDVFRFSFTEVAEITAHSVGACKQAASSARAHLARPRRYDVSAAERGRVVDAFRVACATGDLEQLIALLDPGVTSRADGGPTIHAARKPVVGAERVARYLLTLMAQQRQRSPAELSVGTEQINGRTGLTIRAGGVLLAALDLELREGRVVEIALIVAPEKLAD